MCVWDMCVRCGMCVCEDVGGQAGGRKERIQH